MSGPVVWHNEADRWATWGTLDPPDACMCTDCVLDLKPEEGAT
jgi:hypothetical protein